MNDRGREWVGKGEERDGKEFHIFSGTGKENLKKVYDLLLNQIKQRKG